VSGQLSQSGARARSSVHQASLRLHL